ncbi:hypothetical protein [Phreatobacter stygius]|uniref:Uncharacterized protein n=1 Tax=Phreatobacter stygius TaxID=1940610 RepID=A0A4D7ANY3_9HYPH|nr:hypothetical protein [Phreatobacter stygius]QCI62874.1 hypothetical protein E8M01_00605 [Phreatobacter stygius]
MATTQAAKVQVDGADEAGEAPVRRPRRPRAATTAAAAPRRAVKPAPARDDGPWRRAFRVGFWVMLVAIAAAATLSIRAGHAPSWRSLSVVCLQALPLFPGMALFWRALEGLRRRFDGAPFALWLGFALIGAAATMLIAPGIVFAVHSRSLAISEDPDGEMTLWHHVFGLGYAFTLYVSTAFRLWWPWGALLPVMVAGLFWRAHRR